MENSHAIRKHSKFSASGSERWLNCAASVALEEKSPPSKDSPWALEGTKAHEVLEMFLTTSDWAGVLSEVENDSAVNSEMVDYCKSTAVKIKKLARAHNAPLLVEKKVFNDFIHPEMFGTCDVIIPVYGDTLFIIDFKYGQGHVVNPEKNTQLIQYALGAAESYDWAFENVTMTIMQPRASGLGQKSWTITMDELKDQWLPLWHKGVARVIKGDSKPFEGSWCHWCRAKDICPLKADKNFKKITDRFNNAELSAQNKGAQNAKSYKKESGQKGRKEIEGEESEDFY